MSVSRLKTIFIAALVLINVFFATIIIFDTYADARNERQTVENICTILRKNGIDIDTDCVRPAGELRTMRTSRGVDTEAAIANAFLGPADMTDQGVIYLYESAERGSAEFSSGGDFVVQLREQVISSGGNATKTVQDLLGDIGIEVSVTAVSSRPGVETVTAVNTFRGDSIFNCVIEFVFEGGSLRSATGRYVTGIEPAEDGAVLSQAGTALLGFLSAVRRGEVECGGILFVEAGYSHSVVGSFGESVLAPGWLVTADSGRYFIDSASGEIRAM